MENKDKTIGYGIKALKELGYSYFEPYDLLKENGGKIDLLISHIQVALNVNYNWNINNNSFGVILDFYYRYFDDNKDVELLHFKNVTEFYVIELKDIFSDKGQGMFEMDVPWEITFVSLAISSGRGMLAAKTAGTFLGTLCFPLLNPEDYIVSKKINKPVNLNNNKK